MGVGAEELASRASGRADAGEPRARGYWELVWSRLKRDRLAVAGGRTSLEIAFGAAAIAVVLGLAFGLVAGYYGRWIDAVVSRMTEFVMGFPILLFVIALGRSIGDRFERYTLHG